MNNAVMMVAAWSGVIAFVVMMVACGQRVHDHRESRMAKIKRHMRQQGDAFNLVNEL
jgi:hypothetical protein